MWFITGTIVLLVIVAFRIIQVSISGIKMRNQELLSEVEKLNNQLDLLSEKESKAIREADIAYKAKGKLLSLMSHEIRTPMNGVIGMATLLSATELTPEQHEYAGNILDCSKILLTNINEILISDMLDFSKIDSESTGLDKKNFDLRNCIEEVLDMFGGRAADGKTDLNYQIDANVPIQIVGDYKRLQQILINLVENAVRFTQNGEVFIKVTLVSETENGNLNLAFRVEDNGTGIDAEKLRELFNPALPADYSTKTKEISKGFGLLICKRLIGRMGGQISVESTIGKGSVFSFNIITQPSQQVTSDFTGSNMSGFEGRQVLVVDDNINSGKILNYRMEQWKLLPVIANSGKHALEILSQVSVDLVIVDLLMPEMDGIQLSQTIKSLYPKTPIILLNQVHDERYKEQTGIFNTVLNKPVRYQKLFDTILTEFRHSGEGAGNKVTLNQVSEDFSKQYPLRILVAEDNPVNQKWIKKILNKIGYECEIVENGKVVLDRVSHDHFDLILMDVQMPEMDGMEATRMIRVCLETQPVIIAMTANVMQGDREECMQSGMNDYISKPVELNELLAMLEKWALSIKEQKDRSKNARLV